MTTRANRFADRSGGFTLIEVLAALHDGRAQAGVVGSLTGSGGPGSTTGVVLFPQIPSAISYGSPIAVAAESCALTESTLCPTVLSDFEVREFPVPVKG